MQSPAVFARGHDHHGRQESRRRTKMTASQKLSCTIAMLACGLGLPRTSFAISGCNNGYLLGTYDAQVANSNFLTVLQSLNTGSTGSTSSSSTTGGLGNNTSSLSGNQPGLGRYYFDGNGTII